MNAVILAAGMGTRLGALTESRPKALVDLAGTPLLDRQLATLATRPECRVRLVGGYRSDMLEPYGLPLTVNEDFATTNMVESLFCAEPHFGEELLIAYGDICYTPAVLQAVLEHPAPACVVIDRDWLPYWQQRGEDPLDDAETLRVSANGSLAEIGQKPSSLAEIEGQYIGLMAFRSEGLRWLQDTWHEVKERGEQESHPFGVPRAPANWYMTDLLQRMIDRGHRLDPVWISRGWVEIDTPRDRAVAARLVQADGAVPTRID